MKQLTTRLTYGTKRVVNYGDTVTNFRGETGTFQGASRPAAPGKSGKVVVNGREYYDKVWQLTVTLTE